MIYELKAIPEPAPSGAARYLIGLHGDSASRQAEQHFRRFAKSWVTVGRKWLRAVPGNVLRRGQQGVIARVAVESLGQLHNSGKGGADPGICQNHILRVAG